MRRATAAARRMRTHATHLAQQVIDGELERLLRGDANQVGLDPPVQPRATLGGEDLLEAVHGACGAGGREDGLLMAVAAVKPAISGECRMMAFYNAQEQRSGECRMTRDRSAGGHSEKGRTAVFRVLR